MFGDDVFGDIIFGDLYSFGTGPGGGGFGAGGSGFPANWASIIAQNAADDRREKRRLEEEIAMLHAAGII